MDAKELKKFREKLNLTPEGLAEKLKVAKETVERWESGESEFPGYLELALKTIEREL